MKQKMFLAVVVFATVITLSGCGCTEWASQKAGEKIMEKTIESQTGGKVDVDSEKGTMNINTDQGSISAGKEAKIPDNFPKDIFIFSDAKVIFSMSGTSGENSYSIAYLTSVSPEEAFSKYKDEMAKSGWQKETEMDMGAQGKILNFKKGNNRIMVSMGLSQDEENAGKTQVGITGGEDLTASETVPSSGVSE